MDRIRDRTGVDLSAGPAYIPAVLTLVNGARRLVMRRSVFREPCDGAPSQSFSNNV